MSIDQMIFGERRLYARKACLFLVDINHNNKNYSSHLRDLSVGGALLDRPPKLKTELGKKLTLKISFRNRPGVVNVKAIVVRSHAGQLAVAFEKNLQSTMRQSN